MIRTFRDKETEIVFNRGRSKRFQPDIHVRAKRKLNLIDAAETLNDLRIPPGNMLEQLSGDRLGQFSVRINRQWRICFEWHNGNAFKVEITDYH